MRRYFAVLMMAVIAMSVACAGINKQQQGQPKESIPMTAPQVIVIGDPSSLPRTLQEWYESNRRIEGLHFTTEKEIRYFLIAAGEKPTDGYKFQDPSFTTTPQSINVSITLNAPATGSVMTTKTTTYPHILFGIMNDQRPVAYTGYDLKTQAPMAEPVSKDAFGKMEGRADATSILVTLDGQSRPQLFFLYGNSRTRIDNLRLQEGERIKITYHTYRNDQYEQLIITNIERK